MDGRKENGPTIFSYSKNVGSFPDISTPEAEVEKMDMEELRSLVRRTITVQPILMVDIMRPPERQTDQGYHPEPGSSCPDWCVCGSCRQMPTLLERKCCRKASCISQLSTVDILILNEGVLCLARMYRKDILVFEDDGDLNQANRHQAYRQFILWTHGRLASGDRRVIPSCCVWRIRDKFPDPFNQYTGYIPSRFG